MKKLLIQILFIAIGSMVFTTFIIQIPNPIFENVGSKDSWINFFGAITGGFLTLYGVWWTIKDQDEKRKKDLAIQYKPILELGNISIHQEEDGPVAIELEIKNVGRGEANSIALRIREMPKDIEVIFLKNFFTRIVSNNHKDVVFFITTPNYSPIEIKEGKRIDLQQLPSPKTQNFGLTLVAMYTDLFGEANYQYYATIAISFIDGEWIFDIPVSEYIEYAWEK